MKIYVNKMPQDEHGMDCLFRKETCRMVFDGFADPNNYDIAICQFSNKECEIKDKECPYIMSLMKGRK